MTMKGFENPPATGVFQAYCYGATGHKPKKKRRGSAVTHKETHLGKCPVCEKEFQKVIGGLAACSAECVAKLRPSKKLRGKYRLSLEERRKRSLERKKRKRYKRNPSLEFYESRAWLELRYRALKESNGRCLLCGRGRTDRLVLHVDHIKPRSKYPELELTLENLQVLCGDCNIGKGNKDETDWR